MNFRKTYYYLSALIIVAASCSKNNSSQSVIPGGINTYKLSYGDSIFYIGNQSADVTVSPVNAKAGTFTAFPDGLVINRTTGLINVSQSEAGMRYRISFRADAGDSSLCFVVIAGINFPDKYYRIESADSIAFPVYNADAAKSMPSGIFDEDKIANNSGCAMKTTNGQINLKESIRNELFGKTPKNDTRKDFEVKYRLDDKSGLALNKIKILLYYYDRMTDVPQDLAQTVTDHQAMTFLPDNSLVVNRAVSTSAKPRPPCIIVIGHNQ